ncbi:helix-turn-helix domain-containing protein [Pantoea agglomerans]
MKNETLGDRIRLRRKSLQLTQKQLAQQVKVSHVAISQWEKKRRCRAVRTCCGSPKRWAAHRLF